MRRKVRSSCCIGFNPGAWRAQKHCEVLLKSTALEDEGGIARLLAALRSCSGLMELEIGKKLHWDATENGHCSDIYVANNLVNMYAKCGSMVDARAVFDSMTSRSVVTWNSLILGYAVNGESQVALEFFSRMTSEAGSLSPRSFVAALKACTSLAAEGNLVKMDCLEKASTIHLQAAKNGFDADIYVASTLVDTYAKCGSMGDAHRVFNKIMHLSVVPWNALMLGYVENGQPELALELFSSMKEYKACQAETATFIAAFMACTRLAKSEEGKEVDGRLVKLETLNKGMAVHRQAVDCCCLSRNVENTLIGMYTECGSMVDARMVFDKMRYHDVVSWTSLILGYVQNGEAGAAVDLFWCMESCVRNDRTFIAALMGWASMAVKEQGKQVEGSIMKVFVANALIDMYAKCGSMVEAREVFEGAASRDVVLWNTLISGYADNAQGDVGLALFERMKSEGCAANARTLLAALTACASLAAKEEGRKLNGEKLSKADCLRIGMEIHSQAQEAGCEMELFVASSLVNMYAKCGSMKEARMVFDKMVYHSLVSWNALLMGYAENGDSKTALEMYQLMQSDGCLPDGRSFVAALIACSDLAAKEKGLMKVEALKKGMNIHLQAANAGFEQDSFVANTLIDMYGKCRKMVEARVVFDRMVNPTVVSWNALILGYAENCEAEVAVECFSRMVGSFGGIPDSQTLLAVLKACSNLAALETGKEIHAAACRYGLDSDSTVANNLVDFYGSCGNLVSAEVIFNSMAATSLVSWTSLISAYSHHGDAAQVFFLFNKMLEEGLQPDAIIFSSILTACSHAGLIHRGKEFFAVMTSKYGVEAESEHYDCMIDMLGRGNHLDEALEMVKAMPLKPNAITWTAILGAARKWKNLEVGKLAFESLIEIDEENCGAYELMENLYGSLNMWEEQAKVVAMRKKTRAAGT